MRNVGRAKARLRAFAHPVRPAGLDGVGKAASHRSPAELHRHPGDATLPTVLLHRAKTLIIDHHAPWNTPDRNRNRGLAGLEIDHGDVVAEAVGDIKRLFVARHAKTPGALADQNVALNFACRYVDDRDMGRVAKCHIGGLAVPGDAQIDRRHVGLAHAGRQKLELACDGEFLPVDDVDLAGQLRRYPQFLPVRGRREAPRPGADHHVLHHIARIRIDEVDEIPHLGGDVDEMAVFADEHALRFGAGRHLLDDDVLVHIDHGKRRAFLVGHVDTAARFIDAEGLRTRPGGQLADHLELGYVDDVDHVVITARDIELGVIGTEVHVARTARRPEILDNLVGLGIDNDEIVGFFVAYEDEAGVLGPSGRGQYGSEYDNAERRRQRA